MSEPMTSPEIEDVLSSIRRLVSDDLRQARALMAATQAEAEAEPASAAVADGEADKLLLTPALRVISSVPDSGAALQTLPEPVPEISQVPADAPFDGTQGQASERDLAAEEEVAFLTGATSFAVVDGDYDDPDTEERTLSSANDSGDEGEILWAAPGEQVEDDVLTQSQTSPVQGHWTAQDVPGVDWTEEGLWSEGDSDPVLFLAHPRKSERAIDRQAGGWSDRDNVAEVALAEVEAEGSVAHRDATEAAADNLAEVFTEKDAEAEFDAFAQSLTATLAEELAETVSETVMDESFHAAPSFRRSAAGLDRSDQSVPALDEQKLREIVREIIREELASTLGERITRNVRKLVRVEINRALTSREFE